MSLMASKEERTGLHELEFIETVDIGFQREFYITPKEI